jgi:hypothetical protein
MEGMLGISVGVVLDWFKSFSFVEKSGSISKAKANGYRID